LTPKQARVHRPLVRVRGYGRGASRQGLTSATKLYLRPERMATYRMRQQATCSLGVGWLVSGSSSAWACQMGSQAHACRGEKQLKRMAFGRCDSGPMDRVRLPQHEHILEDGGKSRPLRSPCVSSPSGCDDLGPVRKRDSCRNRGSPSRVRCAGHAAEEGWNMPVPTAIS
jgi:hypothetical protein